MSTDQIKSIDKALDLFSLHLPAKPRVVALDFQPVEDSSGEESLEIFVLFDDRTTDSQIASAPIHEIKGSITDSLSRNGVCLFPYFTFLRQGERHAHGGKVNG